MNMVFHIRNGTIWCSVPYVQYFISTTKYDSYDCGYLHQGTNVDGENAVHNRKVYGSYSSGNALDNLPPAVSSGFVVNGFYANHFNLYEREFNPNYTRIRLRMWPGTWEPYDTPDARYDPPRYPPSDDVVDYDVTYTVAGEVEIARYGWLRIPSCQIVTKRFRPIPGGGYDTWFDYESKGPIEFPTIGSLHWDIPDQKPIDPREYVEAEVNRQVALAKASVSGLHDTLVREAVDSLPSLHTNNIDNVKQIIEIVTAIVKRDFPEIPKHLPKLLAKGWLSYRYMYTTTKLDIEEMSKQIPRMLPDDSMIGRSRARMKNIECASKLHVRDKYRQHVVDRLYTFLDRWGLAPTWENLWDLQPFTFMIDWFTDWADFAHEVHTQRVLSQQYDVISHVFSWKIRGCSNAHGLSIRFIDYDRSVSGGCYLDRDISWYRNDHTKNKTWCFRFLDGVSMLIS